MRLLSFAQTMFEILFVIRTFQIFRGRAIVSTSFVTKAGTVFVSAALLFLFLSAPNIFAGLILSAANILCAVATLFWQERRQIDALKNEIPYFLDRWVLNLRLGTAQAHARERALRAHSESFQSLIRPLFISTMLSTPRFSHALLSPQLLGEIRRIESEPHLALARLENIRATLRQTHSFRRKSGQAMRQTQIQSSLMLVMLFALILFTLKRYGWSRVSDLILAAVFLSVIGVGLMYLLARKTKWKI